MTRDDAPSLNPTLAPHTTPAPEHRSAEQGPAPADLPPATAVPAPSGDALSAREVEALMGGADASMTEANMALDTAEGIDPDTES